MINPRTVIQLYHENNPIADFWIIRILDNDLDKHMRYVQTDGFSGAHNYKFSTEKEAQIADALFHKRHTSAGDLHKTHVAAMQKFETGATRTGDAGKLNYVRALSPIVLERYVQYLNSHRKQADGTMREFDNWKKGIPTDRYLEGLGRHFISAWMLAQGYSAEDERGPVTLEDTLCAIIFGASGWLHEIIKDKRGEK